MVLSLLVLNTRPLVRSATAPTGSTAPQTPTLYGPGATAAIAAAPGPPAGQAPTPAATPAEIAADLPLRPCRDAARRAACDAVAAELAAYGLDIAGVADWPLFALDRIVEAVHRLADALGGGGFRAPRIVRFVTALHLAPNGTRVRVAWQATPQQRDGAPVRGGYGADTLFFNPNTLFLDRDTPEESLGESGPGIWWNVVHELAHLWDERSAPAPDARFSARLQRWLDGQAAAGRADERPSSYAFTGGVPEAFAESVAATVTGDAAVREYYGSPRDDFVRMLLCEAGACLP